MHQPERRSSAHDASADIGLHSHAVKVLQSGYDSSYHEVSGELTADGHGNLFSTLDGHRRATFVPSEGPELTLEVRRIVVGGDRHDLLVLDTDHGFWIFEILD